MLVVARKIARAIRFHLNDAGFAVILNNYLHASSRRRPDAKTCLPIAQYFSAHRITAFWNHGGTIRIKRNSPMFFFAKRFCKSGAERWVIGNSKSRARSKRSAETVTPRGPLTNARLVSFSPSMFFIQREAVEVLARLAFVVERRAFGSTRCLGGDFLLSNAASFAYCVRRLFGRTSTAPALRWKSAAHLDLEVYAEDGTQFRIRNGCLGAACQRLVEIARIGSGGDQFEVVDGAEGEQQLRSLIQASSDTIKHGGKVLAQVRRIGATTTHGNFARLREQPGLAVGQTPHGACHRNAPGADP